MTAQVIVVGSGPAGVSAAWPLVKAGAKVLLVDGGTAVPLPQGEGSYFELRTDQQSHWRFFLGANFYALKQAGDVSPKLRVPGLAPTFAGFTDRFPVAVEDFKLFGSLARGGLSNAWGAGVAGFTQAELAALPVPYGEVRRGLQAVTKRIGVHGEVADDLGEFFGSGFHLQPPPPLELPAQVLLSRYQRQKKIFGAFVLGRGRNAVLTEPKGDRLPCNLCGLCLYGCSRKAIYNAAFDLEELEKHENFRYVPRVLVEELMRVGEEWEVRGRNLENRAPVALRAPAVVLACGAVGTGFLVLKALRLVGIPIRLLSSPVAAFALLIPNLLGCPTRQESFGLSQLAFKLSFDPKLYAFGNLFSTSGLPPSEFLLRSPLFLPTSRRLFRYFLPAMLVGNCFFSSVFSRHEMELCGDGSLRISGGYSAEFPAIARKTHKALRRAFFSCGAWLLPKSFRVAPPGSDIHYAGTVPLRSSPQPHEALPSGEVAGLPGVWVADAAALPELPAKPHTLLVMALADRVGREVARRLKAYAKGRIPND